jgi:hypothetical protein
LQSDKGLHVYYEDPDYWNEIEFPFLGETQAFEEISSLNGILSIEKNDYSDPDSLFNVRLYIEKGKEIKLVFTDKIQCDYSSWYPQFYIIPDEINEYVALLAQPQYNNKDSDHILKAWFYKIEKDGLKKINETALFVNAGTQISTMSLSKKNGFEIFTTRGTVNEVIQLSGQTFATKKINRISDDYKQLQSFSYSDEVYSLLEKDGSLFIGSKMSAKSNNELYRIDWNGLDTIVNPEVSFEPAGKDTLLLSLYGKCKSTSQTKMFKLFCKKITDEKKFLVFKEKEIGLSDNFIYDPVSNCSYFSRGSKMYFQPIFSDLEFDLDNLPGNAGGIHCINDQIIVFYDCQYDAGVPCVSFAAFNKPVIKKIPDSLAISLLTENSTASNFYFSTGLSFDNDLNFYKGHTNVSGFESQHCPNADSLYTFFKWVDPSRRNKVRIFSNPEELENIGEEYPNPDPEGWMDNQVLLSPDGRWIFVRIEDKLEVVDLIQGGNLGLNLNMPEINIGHVISNSFAISGEYLFLLYDNFIYRLNMPSLIARKLQQ